jgi:23S rRNA pseudouridine1911/1915/1917 synthase
MVVHPAKGHWSGTLTAALAHHFQALSDMGGPTRPGIVHRLDRETSGLVLVAKTAAAARDFGLLMQRHSLRKEYVAIVWGWPEWERKLVDAPLGRQSKYQCSVIWLKQMIHVAGAPAQTEFFVERRFKRSTSSGDRFSVIRAIPRTGRTHQIRVHLTAIGHPIIGDKIYGPDEQLYLRFIETGWTHELEQKLLLPRHALHSAKLASEDEHVWTSALPPDLAEFCSGGV